MFQFFVCGSGGRIDAGNAADDEWLAHAAYIRGDGRIDGPAKAPAGTRGSRGAELACAAAPARGVRFVIAPTVTHGTSLGLTLASTAHGHVKVASLAPGSPLAGKLWPGEVVIIIDGESTTHLTPDEAQQRLDDAPGVQHNLLICAEEGEEEDDGTLTVDNAGVQRTQLVREPSIAKTFAPPPPGSGRAEVDKQAVSEAAAAALAAQSALPTSLSAATDTVAGTGARLIYRVTFESGSDALGLSLVLDSSPVTVAQVG